MGSVYQELYTEQTDPTIQAALAAIDQNNYISLDEMFFEDEIAEHPQHSKWMEIQKEVATKYDAQTPESIYEEQDLQVKKATLFERLSAEAKQIVSIIIDCPAELTDICFAGQRDKVDIERLASLMRKQWGERLFVKKLFKEVTQYAVNIKKLNQGESCR
jgi:hypothetical protein